MREMLEALGLVFVSLISYLVYLNMNHDYHDSFVVIHDHYDYHIDDSYYCIVDDIDCYCNCYCNVHYYVHNHHVLHDYYYYCVLGVVCILMKMLNVVFVVVAVVDYQLEHLNQLLVNVVVMLLILVVDLLM